MQQVLNIMHSYGIPTPPFLSLATTNITIMGHHTRRWLVHRSLFYWESWHGTLLKIGDGPDWLWSDPSPLELLPLFPFFDAPCQSPHVCLVNNLLAAIGFPLTIGEEDSKCLPISQAGIAALNKVRRS